MWTIFNAIVVALVTGALLTGCPGPKPEIELSQYPDCLNSQVVKGFTRRVDADSEFGVFVYTQAKHSESWVLEEQSPVKIQLDGVFECPVTQYDPEQVAAVVAPTDGTTSETSSDIPLVPGEMARTVVRRDRHEVELAGHRFVVRTNICPEGPNETIFHSENVFVDEQGHLHLKIRNENDAWSCSEIALDERAEYGTYCVVIDGDMAVLDPNTVFAPLFLIDDTMSTDDEADIEFSRFGDPTQTNNAQFVVQPDTTAGNAYRFNLLPGNQTLTLYLVWQPDFVAFYAYAGEYSITNLPARNQLLQSWKYAGDHVPQVGQMKLHANFWLVSAELTSGASAEVIIQDFSCTREVVAPPSSVFTLPACLAVYRTNGTFNSRCFDFVDDDRRAVCDPISIRQAQRVRIQGTGLSDPAAESHYVDGTIEAVWTDQDGEITRKTAMLEFVETEYEIVFEFGELQDGELDLTIYPADWGTILEICTVDVEP